MENFERHRIFIPDLHFQKIAEKNVFWKIQLEFSEKISNDCVTTVYRVSSGRLLTMFSVNSVSSSKVHGPKLSSEELPSRTNVIRVGSLSGFTQGADVVVVVEWHVF